MRVRLWLLLTLPLVICACSTASSASPVAVVSPAPSPMHQTTAIPHFTQPPPPPPTCEDVGLALTPDFHPRSPGSGFKTGRAPSIEVRFDVLEVVDRADPSRTWAPDPDSLGRGDDVVGYIIGGREVPLPIYIGGNAEGIRLPIEITNTSAHLRITGGSSRDLEVRIEEGADGAPLPILTLPDIEATGFLDFELAWQDQCLIYRASATTRVRFVSRATIDACLREDDPSPYLDTLEEPAPEVDGVPTQFFTGSAGWVWREGILAVDGPIFGAFDPDAPVVTGTPGMTVSIVATEADLAFSSAYASFYRRGDVIDWDTSRHTPEPMAERRAREQPDGTFTVRLPSNPGRYVAIAGFGWHSPCMTGGSRAIFAVDVE